jgi:hypothetical protein
MTRWGSTCPSVPPASSFGPELPRGSHDELTTSPIRDGLLNPSRRLRTSYCGDAILKGHWRTLACAARPYLGLRIAEWPVTVHMR